jgi:hypothetical protein
VHRRCRPGGQLPVPDYPDHHWCLIFTKILLLAQLLGFLDLFVRLFFLWGLGGFFFRGFLRFLTFAHHFLRLNMACGHVLSYIGDPGNPGQFAAEREANR